MTRTNHNSSYSGQENYLICLQFYFYGDYEFLAHVRWIFIQFYILLAWSYTMYPSSCADPESFGFGWWGEIGSKYHYKRVTIGPPVKRHLMAFRWRAVDGPTLNAGFFRGSWPVLLRNSIFLWFFSGGGVRGPPSWSAHVNALFNSWRDYYQVVVGESIFSWHPLSTTSFSPPESR